MWSSSFFLGNFVGPTIAGFTVEHFGFQATTDGFVISFIPMLLVNIFELVYNVRSASISSRDYALLPTNIEDSETEVHKRVL